MTFHMKTAVRCRAFTEEDTKMQGEQIVAVEAGAILLADASGGQHRIDVDSAYGPEASNARIYEETVMPLVLRAYDGYNASVVFYGMFLCVCVSLS
jgi:hypothetical protein